MKRVAWLLMAGVAMAGCASLGEETDELQQAGGGGFTLIGPSGPTTDAHPAFSWSSPGGLGDFRLWIDGYYDSTFTEAQLGCVGGGTCTSPTIQLPSSITTDWWVQAVGTGEWTGPLFFTTGTDPIGHVLIGPSGTTADQYPTFSWSSPGLGDFRLWIDGYYDQVFTEAQLGCVGGGTCTSPNIGLPASITTDWWVQAVGTGNWAGPLYFTTGTGSPVPPGPALIGPSGSSADSAPLFQWSSSTAATTYRLWIDGLYDATFSAVELGCSGGGTCTTGPVSLPPSASPQWYVHASNVDGGNWSTSLTFTVGPMAPATLIAPSSGTSADSAPVFTWSAAPAGTSYRLWIADLHDQTFSAESLGCAGGVGTCTSAQIPLPPDATAQWYVQAISPYSDAWSSFYIFTVGSLPPVPAAAALLGPSGSSTNSGPVFTWTGSGAAHTYRLWISGLYDQTYSAAYLGCASGGTCTTPSISLPPGANANWYVHSSNDGGGTWSSNLQFTVGTEPAPVNHVAPLGSATTSEVFAWTPTLDAVSYRLWIEGTWDVTYLPGDLGCSSGTCTSEAITLASGTRSWYVQTVSDGGSTWSAGAIITTP